MPGHIDLSDRDRDRFLAAIGDADAAPNAALLLAAERYRALLQRDHERPPPTMSHLRHILGDLYGVGSGLAIWAVGAMEHSAPLQYVGAFVGLAGVAFGASREIREWRKFFALRRDPDRAVR